MVSCILGLALEWKFSFDLDQKNYNYSFASALLCQEMCLSILRKKHPELDRWICSVQLKFWVVGILILKNVYDY